MYALLLLSNLMTILSCLLAQSSSPPTEYYIQSIAPPYSSIPHHAYFNGFSLELSFIDLIVGSDPATISPSLLNYLQNLVDVSGGPLLVRVGGNSQDSATVDANQKEIIKIKPGGGKGGSKNPNDTPSVTLGLTFFKTLRAISDHVNVQWIIGLPLVFSTPSSAEQIAAYAASFIGDHLWALQLGNEPDLYERHGKRPAPYGPQQYIQEFNDTSSAVLTGDSDLFNRSQIFIAPSTCCTVAGFSALDTINAGLLTFADRLKAIAIVRYPANNCRGNKVVPLEAYTSHLSVTTIASNNSIAVQASFNTSLPFLMVETNTASCGGLEGISNVFAAALWAVDWALALAFNNHATALFHVGSPNALFNPIHIKNSQSSITGPVYYAQLLIAECIQEGSRVFDYSNYTISSNDKVVVYAIYDLIKGNVLEKLVAINYFNNSDQTLAFPSQGRTNVTVKRLSTSSSQGLLATDGFLYAGQSVDVNGRLQGTLYLDTITCADTCILNLAASSAALVYFQ